MIYLHFSVEINTAAVSNLPIVFFSIGLIFTERNRIQAAPSLKRSWSCLPTAFAAAIIGYRKKKNILVTRRLILYYLCLKLLSNSVMFMLRGLKSVSKIFKTDQINIYLLHVYCAKMWLKFTHSPV